MIARYLVFAGEVFYPNGGMQDLYSSHDELPDAIASAENYTGTGANGKWAEVFDTLTMKPHDRYHGMRLDEEFEFGREDDE